MNILLLLLLIGTFLAPARAIGLDELHALDGYPLKASTKKLTLFHQKHGLHLVLACSRVSVENIKLILVAHFPILKTLGVTDGFAFDTGSETIVQGNFAGLALRSDTMTQLTAAQDRPIEHSLSFWVAVWKLVIEDRSTTAELFTLAMFLAELGLLFVDLKPTRAYNKGGGKIRKNSTGDNGAALSTKEAKEYKELVQEYYNSLFSSIAKYQQFVNKSSKALLPSIVVFSMCKHIYADFCFLFDNAIAGLSGDICDGFKNNAPFTNAVASNLHGGMVAMCTLLPNWIIQATNENARRAGRILHDVFIQVGFDIHNVDAFKNVFYDFLIGNSNTELRSKSWLLFFIP